VPLNSEAPQGHYQAVLSTIYQALADLNFQLQKRRIELHPETKLFGPEGELDSMELCNFIIIAEEKLKETFGIAFDLTQDDPFSPQIGHFKTVGSLATYVTTSMQVEQ
jgi:acyl carrier protein